MKVPNLRSVASFLLPLLLLTTAALRASAQQQAEVVPTLVNYTGTLTDLNGKPLTTITGMTFLLYKDQSGGAPLWLETQNVTPDKNGHYTAVLGSTTAQGLPTDLFASGEARWLAVQPEGQAEQPRVLLVSVPYALKAGDAQTLGGLPASAFMQANGAKEVSTARPSRVAATAAAKTPPPANPDVTGKGTAGNIPMWDSASDIVNSTIFEKSNDIGIATTTPAATLDVNGKSDVRDTLTLFPKSTDSTLAISGTPFKIDQTGKVTFISGQTFPGAGTITGITTSGTSGLQGGGTKGTLNLSVKNAGITNTMLQNSKVTLNANSAGGLTAPGAMTLGSTYTIGLKPCSANQILEYSGSVWNCSAAGTGTITGITAGTDLTGGGSSGKVTLNLDTTQVPQLKAANLFTQTLSVSSNNPLAGAINATSAYQAIVGTMTTNDSFAAAITGNATATGGGTTIGTAGFSSTNSGYGVYGVNSGTGGIGTRGVWSTASTLGKTTANVGVWGDSTAGDGVHGSSDSSIGVVGESGSFHGVSGSSSGAGAAGVIGQSSSTGYGVLGYANGSAGQGVWGESYGTGNANSAGSDGVHGVSHSTAGSGVAGVNTATDATGVYGSDPSGYGFVTDSHTQQARGMGGWVKAMAYVNPTGTGILRCFNSQLNGSAATTVPCGMTFTYVSTGDYQIDFGFQVDDRFFSATAGGAGGANNNPYICLDDVCSISSTQADILFYGGFDVNSFFVVVY